MSRIAVGFHQYIDTVAVAGRGLAGLLGTGTATTVQKHFVVTERTLSFRFATHFHPYAGELVRRVLTGSVAGLQAADTEYRRNPDGTYVPTPATTQAVVPRGTELRRRDGTAAPAAGDVTVTLDDGATVAVDGGAPAALPGTLVMVPERGTRLDAGGAPVVVPRGGSVQLAADTGAALPGGERVTVPAGTRVALLGASPRPVLHHELLTADRYGPDATVVGAPFPVADLDFGSSGAYAVYNWELFYHVPLTVAINLSKSQRFAEAQRWFHLIFDPTDDSDGPTPERFWKVKPFQFTDVRLVEDLLVNLATGADAVLQQETVHSIGAWRDAPFRPHAVARYRPTAFMFKAVMAYLDNLLDWGDSLFRQDTGETVNEAMQLYVLAAGILGPRPQAVPRKGTVRPQTYANLRSDLDRFGNALRDVEAAIPFDLTPHPEAPADTARLNTLLSIGQALYFDVPRNDQLLAYWDRVADRLFKIRNSLNIQGIFRQLPLFEPPIDPALLARAVAAGVDVAAAVSGANQPLSLVRFPVLLQRAKELCGELKALGAGLLSAIEKLDGERLAVLRAQHEHAVLRLGEAVRYAQWQEAVKAREGLERTLGAAAQRYRHFERLLGRSDGDIDLPELSALDVERLLAFDLSATEPTLEPRPVPVDIARDLGEVGGRVVSTHELAEVLKLKEAREAQDEAAGKERIGAGLALVPELGIDFHFWGIGGHVSFGGSALSRAMSFWASFARADAEQRTYEAGSSSRIGGYARREQEWAHASNQAGAEIGQLFTQLRAAQIREAITEREWHNHQHQIECAAAVEHYLTDAREGRTAGTDFYGWMKRELRALHTQCFQLAHDTARKAEVALQRELGDPQLRFVDVGYLSGEQGLLAGERLSLDLQRMELAHADANQREYELTKHVSVQQLDPQALLRLRATGRCTVTLPEAVFDLDGPGHYFRRIRSVGVSVPSVVGPHTTVPLTLTLLKSSIRTSALLRDGEYARDGAEDDRFSDNFSSLQSIVTSTAQEDVGVFDPGGGDGRRLPFELSGAISEWQLELPAELRQFDYGTIADVVLHVRYTAREGGMLLRKGAVDHLRALMAEATGVGCARLLSVRHEMPSAWARFKASADGAAQPTGALELTLRAEHYPLWAGAVDDIVLDRVDLVARAGSASGPAITVADRAADGPGGARHEDELVGDRDLPGMRVGTLDDIPLPAPVGPFTLFLDDTSIEDLMVVLTWRTS